MNFERILRIAIASVIGLAIAAVIAWWSVQSERTARTTLVPATTLAPGATVGGDFSLVDHTGRAVTSADYAGRFRLMFFGFTYCPDICPTELQVMARVMDQLGEEARHVAPLFVTVDPERDTPTQLAEYVALFHPSIQGLTGTPEQVRETANRFRVYYAKAPGADAASYVMDHSTYTYLMGPGGEFLTIFARGTTAEDIAGALRSYLGQSGLSSGNR